MLTYLKEFKHKLFTDITEIPVVFQQSYYPSLDGLRAVSIFIVLVFHILMSYKFDFNFYSLADLGVQFFFVISGFLITSLLIKEKVRSGTILLKNFYIRRFLRILPVAYLYLIVVVILNYILKLQLDYLLILTSFLFIRNFFTSNSSVVNNLTTHYWSLSVEEQFYIIFPAIIRKSLTAYIIFLISIIILALITNIYNPTEYILNNNIQHVLLIILQLINQFIGIAVGSLLSILIYKKIIRVEFIQHALTSLLLFAATIALTFYEGILQNFKVVFQCILFCCILIPNLKQSKSIVFRFLNHAYMKWIGILSYSLYIWQQPLTLNLTFINKTSFMQQFENKIPIDIAVSLLSIIGLIFISYISYHFYEKKFLILKERFK